MTTELKYAIMEAAIPLICGIYFTLRSMMGLPRRYAFDLDKATAYRRANDVFRWLGPFLTIIGTGTLLKAILRY